MSEPKGGRGVFIGNIPYGKVLCLRLEFSTNVYQVSLRRKSFESAVRSDRSYLSDSSTIQIPVDQKDSALWNLAMQMQQHQQFEISINIQLEVES